MVQVYGSVPDSGHLRPRRRLVGFARVVLAPGDSTVVDIPLDLRHLDLRLDGEWVTEDLPVLLEVGFCAGDAPVTDPARLHRVEYNQT